MPIINANRNWFKIGALYFISKMMIKIPAPPRMTLSIEELPGLIFILPPSLLRGFYFEKQ
jgi:hypothetical protein